MKNTLLRAAALGWISGIRSMASPALLMHHFAATQPKALRGTVFQYMALPGLASLMKLVAGAEMVGDKLPFIPARTDPLPLAGRAASGALVGAALSQAEDESPLMGAVIGAVAAVASTFAMYYIRKALTQNVGVPDPLVAMVEDSIATGGGLLVTREG